MENKIQITKPNMCDETCMLVVTFIMVAIIYFILRFIWYHPIVDDDDQPMRFLSVVLAIVFFPIYCIIYSIQHPLVISDREWPLLTVLLVIFFWPIIFVLN